MTTTPTTFAEAYLMDPSLIGIMPSDLHQEETRQKTEEHEAKFGNEIVPDARVSGRPKKIAPRRITEVRGLRLESALWNTLENLAEEESCSINRYIEESILQRIGIIQNESAALEALLNEMFQSQQDYIDQAAATDNVMTFVPAA